MGKSTISTGPFSIAMLVHQRVSIVNDDPFSVLWQARGMLQLGAQLHEATALRGSGHRLKKGDRSSGAKIEHILYIYI